METVLFWLVIIILIGAFSGGNSLGETVREGCSTIIGGFFLVLIALYFLAKHSN